MQGHQVRSHKLQDSCKKVAEKEGKKAVSAKKQGILQPTPWNYFFYIFSKRLKFQERFSL